MENKAAVQSNYADANGNMLATSSGAGCVSPNMPATEISTCQPSVCGGATCYSTCSGQNTCFNTCGSTCSSTCQNTCSQNTCTNTCAGGNCPYNYIWQGQNYWHYQGRSSYNWRDFPLGTALDPGTTKLVFSDYPSSYEETSWGIDNGFYCINKWYQNQKTNTYYIRSDVEIGGGDLEPVDYYAILYSDSPPNNSGIYLNVDFYFYDN